MVVTVVAATCALGCQDATAPAAALVTGEYGITDIAVDSFFVYFSKKDGTVRRVPIDGGSIETIGSGLVDPRYIAIDETDVYCVTSTGTLARVPKAGGIVARLLEGANDPQGIAVDDVYVYFTVLGVNGPGALRKVLKADGSEDPEPLAANQSNPGALALSVGRLYWSVDRAVLEMSVEGGVPATFLADQSEPVSVAADSTYVYWANSGDQTVSRVGVDGSDARIIATEQVSTNQVAGDETNIYWTSDNGTLSVGAVDGGTEPWVLSSGPMGPVRLALDMTSVYWANFQAGTVLVRPKP